jgi:predicted fused transcriptional regulator/phosphomethylpyrimidine kinase/predicted XRE-type DNA-binding protein
MVEEAILIQQEDTIRLKKSIAQTLYRKKIDQPKISEILQISQPMVSNYITSKEQIPKNIQKLAEKISKNVLKNKKPTFHTTVSFTGNPLEGSFYIANKNEVITDENNSIVNNLTEAFLILKGRDISGLVPEIKINIAMTKEHPESTDDVAAFLNGLIIADDKVTGYNGIRFGRSRHLSSLLLDLKQKIDINAMMNIAFIDNIEKTGLSFDYLTKDFKLNKSKKNYDILLHKGDFGIEPCAYVLGKNAVDVAHKVLKIKEEIK